MATTSPNHKLFGDNITIINPEPSPVNLTEETISALAPYATPTPGLFPIIALGNPQNHPDTIIETTITQLKNCGITCSASKIFSKNISDTNKAMDTALKRSTSLGLRQMLRWDDYSGSFNSLDQMRFGWSDISHEFSPNATVGAWMIEWNVSADLVSSVSSILPFIVNTWRKIPYVAMGTSKGFSGSTSSSKPFEWFGEYADYVTRYATTIHTPVWTNRFYAFHDSLLDTSIRSGYFQNLEMFRRLSYSTHRPWWGIAKAGYANPDSVKSESLATDEVILSTIKTRCLYETHTMLAFGAQAIGWTEFFNTSKGQENAFLSPIGQNGDVIQEIFQIIENIDIEIQSLSYIFLGSSVREIRFSDSNSVTSGFSTGLSTRMGALHTISLDPLQGTRGVLMSRIQNMGNEYTVIVNIDPTKSQTIRVGFTEMVSQVRPYRLTLPGQSNLLSTSTFTLKPGEWAIFSLQLFENVNLD